MDREVQLHGFARRNAGILIVAVLFLVISSAFNLLVLPYESFDEPAHIAYAERFASTGLLPNLPGDNSEAAQPPAYYLLVAIPLRLPGAGQPGGPTSAALPGDPPLQIFHHPAAEYCAVCSHGRTVHVLRVVSTLLGLLVVLFGYALGRLLVPGERIFAIGVAAATAFETQFDYVTSVVNNDALAFAVAAAALWGMAGLVLSPTALRRSLFALATGIALGVGLLTKEYVFILLPVAGLALLLARDRIRDRIRNGGLMVVPTLAISGLWLARNLQLYGQPWPFRTEFENVRRLLPLTVWNGPAPLWYFRDIFPREFFESFWYSGGWGQIRLPHGAYVALAVVSATLAVGFVIGLWRAFRATPQAFRVLLLLTLFALLSIVGSLYSNLTIHQPQGRYLLPALPALAAIWVIGSRGLMPGSLRAPASLLPGAALAGLTVATLLLIVAPAYKM